MHKEPLASARMLVYILIIAMLVIVGGLIRLVA
jgi:hypothetical protein